MWHQIVYDNKNLLEFGVLMADCDKHAGPQRDITVKKVPGLNGELTLDNGRYNNYTYTINAYVRRFSQLRLQALKEYLMTTSEYRPLEDSMHPGTYLMARYIGPFTVKQSDRMGGAVDLKFDCKPQRFYKSGDTLTEITTGGTLKNPSLYPAKPLIRVYGTGTLYVGSYPVVIESAAGDYTDIDCEMMECYCGTASCNSAVTLANDFPELPSGTTTVIWTDETITSVQIAPRWWTV